MKRHALLLAAGAGLLLWWLWKPNSAGKAPIDSIRDIGSEMQAQLKKGLLALDTQDKKAIAAQAQQVSQWQSGIDMQFQDAISTWGDKQAYLTQLSLMSTPQPGSSSRRTTTGPLYN